MKLFLFLLTLLLILNLTACQNNNPLLTKNKKLAAKFIYQAQLYAMEETHLYDTAGSPYLACIRNPEHFNSPFSRNNTNQCDRFYKSMLSYSKKTRLFNQLSIKQLKDKAVAKRLAKDIRHYEITEGRD